MSIETFSPQEQKEIPKILRIGVDLDDTVVEYGNVYFRAIRTGLKLEHRRLSGRKQWLFFEKELD